MPPPPTPVVVDSVSQEVEFDCRLKIGKENFQFFQPVEIGDFVVMLWTRDPSVGDWHSTLRYSVSIYDSGRLLSKRDLAEQFETCNWAKKILSSWTQETFSREELCALLNDLHKVSSKRT
jgi:hypothetical protein